MPKVHYGSTTIHYTVQVKERLRAHYISVQKHEGIVLKGASVTVKIADQLVLNKARWILQKLKVVAAIDTDNIVTGSRIQYLGKSYYVEMKINPLVTEVVIEFNHSKFLINTNKKDVTQQEINAALEVYYKTKAIEKILPRIDKFARTTSLIPSNVNIRKMTKRWGSCTPENKIILNADAIKLPYTLIDYLIVHELCHIEVKDHSKAFWALLSKHVPNWKMLDERINDVKL